MTYYTNTCKFYFETLTAIGAEKKMALKLKTGYEIPEFFYFYLSKIGIKDVPNTAKREGSLDGSFFELVKFIASLKEGGKDKEARLEEFRLKEPSWYTQELLSIIAKQTLSVGIGKKKLEAILDEFVPLRLPEQGEEFDPDEDYTREEVDVADMEPLEEAELYKTYIMAAKAVGSKTNPVKYPAMVQKKYDGTRRLVFCTGHNVFFKSRQGKNGLVPPHIEDAVWELYEANAEVPFVLDGEFYVPGIDRAKSNGIANMKDISKQSEIVMAVWDFIPLALYNNLEELEKNLYCRRYNALLNVLPEEEDYPLEIAEWWNADSKEDAEAIAETLANEGEEGGVLKDFRLTFENGRSDYCIKLKRVFDCNLVITGINPGEGKFAGMVGSFNAESKDGKLRVSMSGMVEEVRTRKPLGKAADKYWIGKIVNITFLQLNTPNTAGFYTLHSPQFVRINDDVTESDDIDTIKTIANATLV